MKLIIVTPDFPPSTIANSRRPSLLAREMHALGHEIQVFTRDQSTQNTSNPIAHEDQSAYGIKRLRDPVHECRKKFGGIRIARILLARLWPDPQIIWVFLVALNLRKVEGNATVVATVNPASMLLLRSLVADRRFHFIYDCLESVSPFRQIVPFDFFLLRMFAGTLAMLEKHTFKRADNVVFTSSENLKTYVRQGLCPVEKATYIPQYCDPNPHATERLPCDGKMIISYVGYFNRDRSPETFLLGLRAFLAQEPDAAQLITVNCYGNGLGLHTHLRSELNLKETVNCHESLEYEDTLEASARSHVLLLVTTPKHNLFFPSKVSEYLAARRPILALVPLESDVATTLKQCDPTGWICPHDNPVAVTRSLASAWNEFKEGTLGRTLPECSSFATANYSSVWDDLVRGRALEAALEKKPPQF